MLASFEFTLKSQKGTNNAAVDSLSCIPIPHNCEEVVHHNHKEVRSLLEGATVGATDQGEAETSEELKHEHECLEAETQVRAAKLEPMHIVDWGKAQDADPLLATCHKWLHLWKDILPPKRDAFLKQCMSEDSDLEEGLSPVPYEEWFGDEERGNVHEYYA